MLLAQGDDNRYLYQKIAEQVRLTIGSGALKPGMRLPSLDRLAETYGVNRITVRRALSDLRDEGLIHAVPAEGTYVAEPQSRPKKNGLLSIGLVSHALHPDNFGPYHMEMIAGMQQALGERDGHLVLMPEGHIGDQSRLSELMARTDLSGVIYLGVFDAGALRCMVEKGPPAILVDCRLRGAAIDSILVDNCSGAYDAIAHLHELGHRRLACILGPADDLATKERLEGVRTVMENLAMAEASVKLIGDYYTRSGGHAAMRDLLAAKRRPTAVFCFNDEMAVGAMQAVLDHGGLSIPRDMSIVGFDDISWATAVHPHLTTIRVEKRLMGQLAVRRLVERLRGPYRDTVNTVTVTPTQLIVRESTGSALA